MKKKDLPDAHSEETCTCGDEIVALVIQGDSTSELRRKQVRSVGHLCGLVAGSAAVLMSLSLFVWGAINLIVWSVIWVAG